MPSAPLGKTLLAVAIAAFFASACAAALLYRIIRHFERPLEGIRSLAARYAAGDFDASPYLGLNFKYPEVSKALISMADALRERMEILTRQRNEQKAILIGMVEAVIVLNSSLEIIEANPAAADLMNLSSKNAKGRSLIDLVRNPDLYTFARETLESGETRETNILLSGNQPRFLEVHGSFIRSQPASIGAQGGDPSERLVLVLHDITNLKQLERVRKDFVANVSHELKTPITSIKGFIETLKEGALSDSATATRFLAIIERQTERMEAIIEDLLSLSRLEQNEGRELTTDRFPLQTVLDSGVELVADSARRRGIEIVVIGQPPPLLEGNSSLIEQALLNLLDNAVKFSRPGGKVSVEITYDSETVALAVRDDGIGIPAKELPRLFERFYRVDRARSRALGGTGLGLAIVKHIALAHGGEVFVESTPGEGSLFTLKIPLLTTHTDDLSESSSGSRVLPPSR